MDRPPDPHLRAEQRLYLDYKFARQLLGHAGDQKRPADEVHFHRRSFVRTAAAYVEGSVFVRKWAAPKVAHNYGFAPPTAREMEKIQERRIHSESGAKQPYYLDFVENIRFSFEVTSRVVGSTFRLPDRSDDVWKLLGRFRKLRNRIMHPKADTALDVTQQDVDLANDAVRAFHALRDEWGDGYFAAIHRQEQSVLQSWHRLLERHEALRGGTAGRSVASSEGSPELRRISEDMNAMRQKYPGIRFPDRLPSDIQ